MKDPDGLAAKDSGLGGILSNFKPTNPSQLDAIVNLIIAFYGRGAGTGGAGGGAGGQTNQNFCGVCSPNLGSQNKTWDPTTDARIRQLDPRVRKPATDFINNTESQLGTQLRVVQGYRSVEEQNRLYEQSRTNPPTGPHVTNAKGGESLHNYGKAVDVVIMEGGSPNWGSQITPEIANIGKAQGFQWGGDWTGGFKDYPHFEMR